MKALNFKASSSTVDALSLRLDRCVDFIGLCLELEFATPELQPPPPGSRVDYINQRFLGDTYIFKNNMGTCTNYVQ